MCAVYLAGVGWTGLPVYCNSFSRQQIQIDSACVYLKWLCERERERDSKHTKLERRQRRLFNLCRLLVVGGVVVGGVYCLNRVDAASRLCGAVGAIAIALTATA